ncbi:hypothetical protein, partial [Streptomyces phytophilus]|uniref:hypothetical protein n=1 Tax=Streptomyces phytophilus TaxID=722715 RepID=UPI0035A99896
MSTAPAAGAAPSATASTSTPPSAAPAAMDRQKAATYSEVAASAACGAAARKLPAGPYRKVRQPFASQRRSRSGTAGACASACSRTSS